MITNANNYIPVNRVDQRLTPFNTGKVQIGLLYQPKAPELTSSEEVIQAILLDKPSMYRQPSAWPVVLGSAILSILLIFLTR